jgi:uncharacterized protein YbaR (Trm112 family)
MVMEFILSPHTKNIIIGRKGGSDVLICASKHCLHKLKEENNILEKDKEFEINIMNPVLIDDDFGKEIEVTGFVNCSRCKSKVSYPEDLGEFNSEKQVATNLICPACKRIIPLKDDKGRFIVLWTQRVVSKHRRNKHDYYHGECWDAMFIDVEDE